MLNMDRCVDFYGALWYGPIIIIIFKIAVIICSQTKYLSRISIIREIEYRPEVYNDSYI